MRMATAVAVSPPTFVYARSSPLDLRIFGGTNRMRTMEKKGRPSARQVPFCVAEECACNFISLLRLALGIAAIGRIFSPSGHGIISKAPGSVGSLDPSVPIREREKEPADGFSGDCPACGKCGSCRLQPSGHSASSVSAPFK
jgi:hypothetical protein